MLTACNRAFKEWAVACDAIRSGSQILLIRKGGIREDNGVFRMSDSEFFLLPTFEHQNAELLRPDAVAALESRRVVPDPASVTIDTYCVVDTILTGDDEASINRAAAETIWNAEYVRGRIEFNPYDPLYLVILRAYRPPGAVTLPLLPEYVGCRSWVTLDRLISTVGAAPVIPDDAFDARRDRLLSLLA